MKPFEALEAFWQKITVPGLFLPPPLRPYASVLGNPNFFVPRFDYYDLPNWTNILGRPMVSSSPLADHLPVVLTFLRTEFRGRIRMDSVATIADAENFSLDLFQSAAAQNQLRFTDVVLLNKCDLVDTERLEGLETKIRRINDRARIARTTRCQILLPLILSVGLFQSEMYYSDPHSRDSDTSCDHNHLPIDGFDSVSFESAQPFAAEKFQKCLEQLPDNV
jgi:G3E family GTPase